MNSEKFTEKSIGAISGAHEFSHARNGIAAI